MNRTIVNVALLSLASPLAGAAQNTTQTASVTAPVSLHEVHNLMKSAHAAAQYQELAGYFRQRETDYRAKAAAEKVELDQLSQVNPYRYQRYPRPVDWAKIRYESYVTDANKAALKAQRYSQLAATYQEGQQLAGTSR